jgi:hypothetical protein
MEEEIDASIKAKLPFKPPMVKYTEWSYIGIKHTASEDARKRSRRSWDDRMTTTGQQSALGFMVCVDNTDYPASLELGKAYEVVPDESLGPEYIRVIDESGEDYVYPASYFSTERQADVAMRPPLPDIHSAIARQIREFIQENESLLSGGSATVLGRVFTQGASIFTTYSKDVVEETNRAAAAKRNLAAAIRDPTTSARRLQELEEEDKRASAIYESSTVASKELQDFLERVKALLPEQRIDEGKEE